MWPFLLHSASTDKELKVLDHQSGVEEGKRTERRGFFRNQTCRATGAIRQLKKTEDAEPCHLTCDSSTVWTTTKAHDQGDSQEWQTRLRPAGRGSGNPRLVQPRQVA